MGNLWLWLAVDGRRTEGGGTPQGPPLVPSRRRLRDGQGGRRARRRQGQGHQLAGHLSEEEGGIRGEGTCLATVVRPPAAIPRARSSEGREPRFHWLGRPSEASARRAQGGEQSSCLSLL